MEDPFILQFKINCRNLSGLFGLSFSIICYLVIRNLSGELFTDQIFPPSGCVYHIHSLFYVCRSEMKFYLKMSIFTFESMSE